MSFIDTDSSGRTTPTSEYESPFSWKRTGSIDPQEVRHPRFPDFSRRGSAAGQHDLVTQAQKGLGPTLSQSQKYASSGKTVRLNQYDLQTQSGYGHGPTVSYDAPIVSRGKTAVQHDLLSQAVYGHGMTVPLSQTFTPAPKTTVQHDLRTQVSKIHPHVDMRNPYGSQRTYDSFDLSSQFRKNL